MVFKRNLELSIDNEKHRSIESNLEQTNKLEMTSNITLFHYRGRLTDRASSIIMKGEHLANLLIGQAQLDSSDRKFFEKQAEEFGFPLSKYMGALAENPLIDKSRILAILNDPIQFKQLVSLMGSVENA